jgi:acyl-CoA thioester hydrolase
MRSSDVWHVASPEPSRDETATSRPEPAGGEGRTAGWSPSLRAKAPGASTRGLRDLGASYAPPTMEQVEIRIRWRDVDNYGHVNNAVYLTYLEECRDRWVRRALGDAVDFVIVRIAIDFRKELSLEDESVLVTCRGTGYGTSSIRTAETIRAGAGWIAAESGSVVVAHDAGTRRSRPLTDAERAALDAAIEMDEGSLSPEGSGDRT